MKTSIKQETTETVSIKLDSDDIRKAFNLPDRADVYVEVPGGGYRLNIGKDAFLEIRYSAKSVEVK